MNRCCSVAAKHPARSSHRFSKAPAQLADMQEPHSFARPEREEKILQVFVRDNNVDQALRVLKKKMQREGVFREMKLRRNYEKPSERRAREKAEAVRRYRKLMRKRMDREGY
jgi:small subunit ribosomal protein S21